MPGTHTRKFLLPLIIVSVAVALSGLALAQANKSISPMLTPKLQELLQKEMQSINDASQKILAAVVAGDDSRVAKLAQQIHDSFILRQSMTPEDKAQLMTVAPEGFVQMDRDFHETAAELATVARAGNKPLQYEQFGRMIETCGACHAHYATDRFTGFSE